MSINRTLCATLLLLAGHAQAQSAQELSLVRQIMAQVQPQSIRENREYCGYVGYDAFGQLTSTASTRGQRNECAPELPGDIDPVASWHTHAGYDPRAWSEVPTVSDFEADEDEGVDGYVGTPGGRLWYVDTQAYSVNLICGPRCIAYDSRWQPGSEGAIHPSYSYQQLLVREAE